MSSSYNVLIMGASYGSLLGTKLLLAGHAVTLVCTAGTAATINEKGTEVRLPVRGRDELVPVFSKDLSASLTAATPENVNPSDYDLVVLGMSEPQYGFSDVRDLLDRVAVAKVPAMAIMNMPPLPYLHRLPGLDANLLLECFTEPDVWKNFEPGLVTLASPDPQAFRPPEEDKNVLQVSLPTNFKVARFESDAHTEMLREIERGIEAVDFPVAEGTTKLPVKLKVYDSLYVPLAKWSMLVTGNYHCVQEDDMRAIKDAVHADVAESEACYQWVVDLCVKLGASVEDMVPFEKYANAAKGLTKPSSGARALFGGAANIERVDLLVQKIGNQQGMQLAALDQTVEFVTNRLAINREARKAS
ncbi:MAG: hypothetical protein KTR32_04915 [Granulosicoccus sp.]|nr:hypothetical protein [Granulosicoccus sp.]